MIRTDGTRFVRDARCVLALAVLGGVLLADRTAHAAVVFKDDFESGTSSWTLTGSWGTTTTFPRSPTRSLTDTPFGTYVGSSSTIARITAPLDLSNASAPRLGFWIRGSSEALHDILYVEISRNGTTWLQEDAISGTQATWRYVEYLLSGYAGVPAFHVRFRFQSDAIVNGDGWYIDDLIFEDGNPAVNLTAPAGGAAWPGNTNQAITWTYDGTFGTMAASFDLLFASDGVTFSPLASGLPVSTTSQSWLVPGINTSQARMRVYLLDAFGAQLASGLGSGPFTIDSTAPGAFNLTAPSEGACGASTPTFDWSDAFDAGGVSYTLTIIPTSASPIVKTGLTASQYQLAPGEALSDANNPHSWTVTALDRAGNGSTASTRSYLADSTPPASFGLASPPSGALVDAATLQLAWQATTDVGCGLAKYRLFVDGVLCADDIPPSATSTVLAATTCTSLVGGAHTWTVSAVDAAGNATWSSASPGGVGGWVFSLPGGGPDAGASDAAPDVGVIDASVGGAAGTASADSGAAGFGAAAGSAGAVGQGGSGASAGGAGQGGSGASAGTAGQGASGASAGDAGQTGGTGGEPVNPGGAAGAPGTAGRGGTAGTGAAAGEPARDGGADATRGRAQNSSGCGCRAAPERVGHLGATLLLALLSLRRRRR